MADFDIDLTLQEDITRIALQALMAGGTVYPKRIYRITDGVGATKVILVKGLTTATITGYAINETDSTYGVYAIGPDTYTAQGGGTGTVLSVSGFAVDNTDPVNPVVRAIPIAGTDPSELVTGTVEFDPATARLFEINDGSHHVFIDYNSGILTIQVEDSSDPDLFSKIIWNETFMELAHQSAPGAAAGLVFQDPTDGILTVGLFTIIGIGSFSGLQYGSDYSGDYTNRSLVDKGYVDNAISGVAPMADATTAGIAKLYDDLLASNTDGAVTQNAVGVAIALLDIIIDAHKLDFANPHGVTKTQVGLGNADNTSDANKPVSTAQLAAIANKSTRDIQSATSSIPSNGTRFFGSGVNQTMSTTGGVRRFFTNVARTITSVEIDLFTTVAGSGEDVAFYIRVNNATDNTITLVGKLNAGANSYNRIVNTGLSVALAANDYFEIKMVTPVMVTAATGVVVTGCIELI